MTTRAAITSRLPVESEVTDEPRGCARTDYMTVVFKTDVKSLENNPFKIESEFGLPVVVAIGDLADELELMHETYVDLEAP